MRYLLDTNALSEPTRRNPDPTVVAWLRDRTPLELHLSVLTLGEVERGILRLPTGSKRERLRTWIRDAVARQFAGRLFDVTAGVSVRWGKLAAEGRLLGRPLPVVDGLLLATAAENDLTLVTRNVSDCAGRGVPVLDPWTGACLS